MFKKMQKFTQNKRVKKCLTIGMCLMMCCMALAPSVFAAEGNQMTAQEAATSIFSTVTENVNVGTVVGVIAIALGAGLGLYFAWWGIRWVAKAVRRGLNGKMPV